MVDEPADKCKSRSAPASEDGYGEGSHNDNHNSELLFVGQLTDFHFALRNNLGRLAVLS